MGATVCHCSVSSVFSEVSPKPPGTAHRAVAHRECRFRHKLGAHLPTHRRVTDYGGAPIPGIRSGAGPLVGGFAGGGSGITLRAAA